MKKYRIAITSIGSGVGQSVIDAISAERANFFVVGMGNNPFAFAAPDCDEVVLLPQIYQTDYIEQLLDACISHQIDLLIPGLDDELFLLAENSEKFKRSGIQILVSKLPTLLLCRDKAMMSETLNCFGKHFVSSFSVQELLEKDADSMHFPMIAKPVSGFASRGLKVIQSVADIAQLSDDMVVQEIAAPHPFDPSYSAFNEALEKGVILQSAEISLQVLIGKNGQELGRFASYNKLQNGVPVDIIPFDNADAWQAVDEFLPELKKRGLYGPINIQGRMTQSGVKFFEMNARFTGITGVRAMLGFNEVLACIADARSQQYTHFLHNTLDRVGLRQVQNRVVSPSSFSFIKNAIASTHLLTPSMEQQVVMITGATGTLGAALIKRLQRVNSVSRIIAVSRKSVQNQSQGPKVTWISYKALFSGEFSIVPDTICHLASGRPFDKEQSFAESVELTRSILEYAGRHSVARVVYASSQAVYGTERQEPWAESMPTRPESLYGLSKWSGENLCRLASHANRRLTCVSLRFSQLYSFQDQKKKYSVINKLLEKVRLRQPILIQGGQQLLDLLHIEDAVDAVLQCLNCKSYELPASLNIGSGSPTSLNELVAICKDEQTPIEYLSESGAPDFGMDITLADKTINWSPKISLSEGIKGLKFKIKVDSNEL